MTWRISKSRPSTGSIFPCFARAVRLTVYWSRFGVLPPACAASPPARPRDAAAAVAAADVLGRAGDDRREVLLAAPRAGSSSSSLLMSLRHARQLVVREQREERVPGANLRSRRSSSDPIVHASVEHASRGAG